MADRKISELTNITGANLADDDEFALVDTSADETKAITFGEFKTALDTATGFVRITGDTMTGALDVQSTITADGLTSSAVITAQEGRSNTAGTGQIVIDPDDTTVSAAFRLDQADNKLNIDMTNAGTWQKKLSVYTGGDISFYEDTGTTAKFFWDASAESLGIGTSSPSAPLHIEKATGNVGIQLTSGNSSDTYINFGDSADTNAGLIAYEHDNNAFAFRTNGSERMRIDSSGNVGIGTTSPSETVHINSGTANTGLFIESTDANSNLIFRDSGSTANIALGCVGDDFRIQNNNSESMRIDSSGNLLVGTTSTGVATLTSGGGSVISSAGASAIAYQSVNSTDPVLLLNNTGVDGDIATFRKDGATVGSIGAEGGDLHIGTGGTHLRFRDADSTIVPHDGSAVDDDAISLGRSNVRFKDLYLSGGVYLGGTGSANLLDDYEYGFFEPEFGGDVSDPTVTYDGTVGNEGWYVKVGRLVFIQINMRTDSVSGGSGAVVIRNLPFVTPNLSGQGGMSSFTIGYADNWAGERPIAGTIAEGVTYINLSHRSAVDGNNITTNITDLGTGANANLIRLSGTYYTTA